MIAFLLFLLASASNPHVQADTISVAVSAVEEFHGAETAVTEDFTEVSGVLALRKKSAEEKEKTVSEIQRLRWVEKPGSRRFKSVYGLVDSYMKDGIKGLAEIVPMLPDVQKGRVEEALEKLKALREKKLKAMEEAYQREVYEKDGKKPVPAERSPVEAPPEDRGLWYR